MRRVAHQLFDQGGIGQNNWLVAILLFVFLINLINTGIAIFTVHPMSVQVPIRYSTLTAFDKLGNWQLLYILPTASWLVSIVNTFLAQATYRRSRITSFMLVIASLGLSLLMMQILLLYTGVTHGAR
ncbi:hypothetical protein IT415_00435 [bacterium]|nr:hypothetical protein [bacterium]